MISKITKVIKVLAIVSDIKEMQNSLTLEGDTPSYYKFIFTENPNNLIGLICLHRPDFIFIDFDLIGCPASLLADIKTIYKRVPLLIGLSPDYRRGYTALKSGYIDCIIKPYTPTLLLLALQKCKNTLLKRERSIIISTPKEVRYLLSSEIRMLKADNNYVIVTLADGNSFTVFNTLSYFQQSLDLPFLRVHKSYIINAQMVSRINYGKKFLNLKGCDSYVPFTKKYEESLLLIGVLKKEAI